MILFNNDDQVTIVGNLKFGVCVKCLVQRNEIDIDTTEIPIYSFSISIFYTNTF